MPEQIKKILNKILEWWKKFTVKQRALLISMIAVVVIALVILVSVISKPTYVPLVICEDMKQAAEVKELLDSDETIDYQVSEDGLTFKVNKESETTANYLLGTNEIPTQGYSIENVVDGSFSVTEADKQKKYQKYLETKFAEHLSGLDNIESATVDLSIPDDDGTILSSQEESSAAVTLELKDELDSDQAYGIAQFVATQLGNDSTEKITIIDSKGNVLFSGADENSVTGVSGSQLTYKQKQENLIKSEIQNVLVQSKVFSNVEVAMNLSVNFDNTETATHEYYVPEGQTTGPIASKSEYESESYGGYAAEPGTGANDDTTYVIEDGEVTSSTISDSEIIYQNSETVTTTTSSGGKIDYDASSVSIVATRYVVYDEAKMQEAGLLDDITFEEFMEQNSEPVQVEVDASFYEMIANATGFSPDSITFLCYEQPEFVPIEESKRSVWDILEIVLTVLIFALLGYVVFLSTRRKKEEEELEPELSVESLLESTAEQQTGLEDIGYAEKSETRVLIEKFVEEKPDAAALLLRNWLNEDWE